MHVITKSCILLLWMHTLTFVKSQGNPTDCTLQDFKNGPLYDPNFDITPLEARYPGGRQVRVGCNVGYTGFFKLSCVEGKWLSRGSKCQLISCGHPGNAQFADFHLTRGEDFVFGSQVDYTCHKGFQMVSRINFRHCMSEGWDGVVPVCEAQECPSIHVPSNVKVTGDTEEATYGNVVRFSCKSSNQTVNGPREVFCNEDGEWSEPVDSISCKDIFCGRPPSLEDGDIKNTTKEHYNPHETIEYMCQSYYTMEGEPYRTCYDGKWTGNMRCIRPCIANEDEMRQHNITFKSSDYNKFLVHDEIIEFKCARGLPVGKVAMRQRCNSGVIVLPTCREDLS